MRADPRLARQQPAGALGHGPADRARTRRGSRPRPAAGLDSMPTTQTLADWPKAASLVPMTRVPVARCRSAMCIWPGTSDGLFLATIAMDYYAPELLGPLAAVSALGGVPHRARGRWPAAGPRRIELRVVPHRSGPNTGLRRPKLSFDAQVCRYAGRATIAPPLPGATRALFRHGARPAARNPEGLYPVAPAWTGRTAAPRRIADRRRGHGFLPLALDVAQRSCPRCRDGTIRQAGRRSGWAARRGTGRPEAPQSRAAERSN